MQNKAHILLVEDDESLAFVIKDNLERVGYKVSLAVNGKEGCALFNPKNHNLCILDVMLPKLDGFKCAEQIRLKDAQTPILFLTAKSMQEDVLQGFKHGGDDYITKPFNFEELQLRIEVFIQRASKGIRSDQSYYACSNLSFSAHNLLLAVDGVTNTLTQKEADLLMLFFDNKNRLLKREVILKQLWGDDDYFMGRSLDVFISKLRKYLKEADGVCIRNHHGVGFKMDVEENKQSF